jgi:amino acid transporter
MVGVFPVLFTGWKFYKKTKWMKPEDVVLRTKEVDEIEEYTRNYVEPKAKNRFNGLLDKIFG